ncbi:hypothetical protein JI752_004990 [Lysobacter sp. MMG2]|uniref:hypothetical protein n=1 Tax=Lysobacter sp. MMG2 TaxID=2801338 RepID=UPI001C22DE59|nr:hypothetical protein [Lysobacter sp. MMG2]MBU8975490.1 hypothetical protein [Lysobacter sp. MMG2]
MPRSPYQKRPGEPRIARDADQIELTALRSVFAVVDDAARDEIVSGELDDLSEIEASEEGRIAWQQQDIRQEELVGEAAQEIKRRIKMMGDAYPFDLAGNRLTYRASGTGFYEFCLVVAQTTNITTGPNTALPRTFERAVTGLVKTYFGPAAWALHTGFPRTPSTRFKAAMAPLNYYGYEWNWQPQAGLPDDPTAEKDETVDFVIRSDFLDQRAGNLYVLGQCACGNDWDTKITDPNEHQISKWFNPPWIVNPIKAFTTPFMLGDESLRETAQRSKGMVFDRARLVLIAERMTPKIVRPALRKRLDKVRAIVG